ncbi:MAG: 2-hydroxyacyl-CoA dehydratase [Deltaproteobacteria bacterium]|nr:2-hydroxyacyl-CoA dehydratase [Deltaproteobacteria bacterium]
MSEANVQEGLKPSVKNTKAAAEVRQWRKWYYDRINHAHDYGEFVALSMLGIPDEIFRTFGVWPSLAENYGPLCAAKQVSGHFCGVAEGDGFSVDLCSYLKVGIGYLSRVGQEGKVPDEAPYGGMGQIDMIIAPATFCDGRYKYPQAARRYVDMPTFVYDQRDLPWWRANDPAMVKRYVDYTYERFKELIAFLESTTGKKLDEAKLAESVALWMKSHKLFHDACELKKCHPNPIPSQDSFAVCFPNLHFKGTQQCVDYYQGFYDEVKAMADAGIGAVPGEEKYRIFWMGLPPWYYLGIFNYLQERGVSTMDSTYDAGDMPEEPDLSNPLYAIAKKAYEGVWFGNGPMRRQNLIERMRKFIAEYDIHGVITLMATTCRANTTLLHHRRLLNEHGGVPVLNLEADMSDVRSFSEVQVRGKLDAFLETVDVWKGKRVH